jgi:DNA-binding MarR family transcriptional regulator
MLTETQECVLRAIAQSEGTLKVHILARRAAVSERTVRRATAALDAAGLITRQRGATRGPAAVYSYKLTDRGRRIAQSIGEIYEQRVSGF